METVVSVLFPLLIVAAVVGCWVSVYWNNYKKKKIIKLEEPTEEPKLLAVRARLISKHSEIKYTSGGRHPEHYVAYYGEFDTAGGTAEYEIDEKTFMETEEGDLKDLVTENGKFFCFSEGEKTE